MKVYVVVIKDRHDDPEPIVFSSFREEWRP
jgi:hypothetical protein